MIELEHISKVYPSKHGDIGALSDINLQIPEATIAGIIGSSGAGKSTLLRCINLLERPSQGRVLVAEQDLLQLGSSELRQVRQNIGMIFQHFNLLSCKTIFDNIALPLKLQKSSEIQQKVTDLLKLVGLSDKAQVYPRQLSGGQKQRVAIARALASNPKILLCDEATSALDPATTADILQLLKTINKKLGITIVLITHEISVIKNICQQVTVLDHGKVVEHGSVLDLINKPQSLAAKQFLQQDQLSLPDQIAKNIVSEAAPELSALIRISFVGKDAEEPVIASVIQELKVKLNILQAQLEYVDGQAVGMMLLELVSQQHLLPQLLQYLENKGLQTEVIGYVPTTITVSA